jgi:phosphohistidine phosphatase SixA
MSWTLPSIDVRRRDWLLLVAGSSLAPTLVAQTADAQTLAALRRGGCVVAFRHANAPGSLDPPGFQLGRCETQRNLDDAGRAQSRRLGAWFREQQLVPAAVRSSPWCRCLDTARLAFGNDAVQTWTALGSPRAEGNDAKRQQAELLAGLARVPAGRFEVWVSHQFTLNTLVSTGTASAEGLVLRANGGGAEQIGRITAA